MYLDKQKERDKEEREVMCLWIINHQQRSGFRIQFKFVSDFMISEKAMKVLTEVARTSLQNVKSNKMVNYALLFNLKILCSISFLLKYFIKFTQM